MKRRKIFASIIIISFVLALGTSPFFLKPVYGADKIELQIWSNPLGNIGYVLSFGLAEIINKYSTKYHATCVESKAIWVNMLQLIKNPEARKNTIIYANTANVDSVKKGSKPYEKPYFDFRYLSLCGGNISVFLASIDPNIRKIEDMVGKRVAVGNIGASPEFTMRLVLDHGYGIWNKLKISNLTFDATKTALLDGTISVGTLAATVFEPGGDWKGNPATDEVLNSKKCYPISYSKEAIAKARKESGFGLYPIVMGPKKYGKTEVTEPAIGVVVVGCWMVDKSMPDEYVRDISKIIYEHADEFAKYHAVGKAMGKKIIAAVAAPEEEFHPAATKFYKEQGLAVGYKD